MNALLLILLIQLTATAVGTAALSPTVFLITGDGDPRRSGKIIDLDFEEQISLEVRFIDGDDPEAPTSFDCYVDHIQITSTYGGKSFSRTIPIPVSPTLDRMRFPVVVKDDLVDPSWNITGRTVDDVQIALAVVFRAPGSVPLAAQCGGYAPFLPTPQHTDIFSLRLHNYGVFLIFDWSALGSSYKNGLDFATGMLNTLKYSSVDYPIVFDGGFKNAMVSAPLAVIESRNLLRHVQLEGVLIRSGSDSASFIGTGLALGLYRPVKGYSLMKVGLFYVDGDPHAKWFIGFSLPAVASWAAGDM
jgi:hypothetical protein